MATPRAQVEPALEHALPVRAGGGSSFAECARMAIGCALALIGTVGLVAAAALLQGGWR